MPTPLINPTARWILRRASLTYDYFKSTIKPKDTTTDYIRYFVKHIYEIEVSSEDKITTPSVSNIVTNTNIIVTKGYSIKRDYPTLAPTFSGVSGVDYLTYTDGGSWNIQNITWTLNTKIGVWTTIVILRGEWNKYLKVPLTNIEYRYT